MEWDKLVNYLSATGPLGLMIFMWISKQLNDLNIKMATIVERTESHDKRIEKVETHLFQED